MRAVRCGAVLLFSSVQFGSRKGRTLAVFDRSIESIRVSFSLSAEGLGYDLID